MLAAASEIGISQLHLSCLCHADLVVCSAHQLSVQALGAMLNNIERLSSWEQWTYEVPLRFKSLLREELHKFMRKPSSTLVVCQADV